MTKKGQPGWLDSQADLTGVRFSRLEVIEETDALPGRARMGVRGPMRRTPERRWICRCDCGAVKTVRGSCLRKGTVLSCGCLRNERVRLSVATHGMANSPEWLAHRNARGRCQNENDEAYHHYGGRGIEFRFESFDAFYAEVGPRPSPAYSIDRIDVNGHYEPGNIRWATQAVQIHNRRKTVFIEYAGLALPIRTWAAITGIEYDALRARLRMYGWDVKEALTTPLSDNHRLRKGKEKPRPVELERGYGDAANSTYATDATRIPSFRARDADALLSFGS